MTTQQSSDHTCIERAFAADHWRVGLFMFCWMHLCQAPIRTASVIATLLLVLKLFLGLWTGDINQFIPTLNELSNLEESAHP